MFFSSIVVNNLFCQTASTDSLFAVRISVIKKDTSDKYLQLRNKDKYYVTISIKNISDTIIKVWLMRRSWSFNNFILNTDSISLSTTGWDIDSEIELTLLPQKELRFYAIMLATKEEKNQSFRIGFLYFKRILDLIQYHEFYQGREKMLFLNAEKNRIYWSKPTKLTETIDDYELIE